MVRGGAPIRVILFGTHPKQFNGYSKVVYELSKELALRPDRIQLSVFGFQNFHAHAAHREDLPANVDVYDAWANENPKSAGFGFEQAVDYVTLKRPDVIVIYNDLMIITNFLQQLQKIPNRWFKILLYIDQVYLSQRTEYINFINQNMDAALAFTPSWKTCIENQGLKHPCDVLEHGINAQVYYPVPRTVARRFLGLNDADFIVLNLNRNQPRKRWDTCIKAFAHVIAKHLNDPPSMPKIKFIIGTAVRGAWDLVELLQRELGKRGVSLEDGMKHLIIVEKPQLLTDMEINVMYNASDCGINTADGEGVGLCNVEAGAIGIPQIVPRVGGFIDFFDDESALMVDPQLAYYVDASRDMVGGEALMCDYADFANAIETYYRDEALRKKHGEASRRKILVPHSWDKIAEHFVDCVTHVHNGTFAAFVEERDRLGHGQDEVPQAQATPDSSKSRSVVTPVHNKQKQKAKLTGKPPMQIAELQQRHQRTAGVAPPETKPTFDIDLTPSQTESRAEVTVEAAPEPKPTPQANLPNLPNVQLNMDDLLNMRSKIDALLQLATTQS